MTRQRALQLAARALELRRKEIAVDANLHEQYGANYAAAINASKERQAIDQALQVLGEISNELSR